MTLNARFSQLRRGEGRMGGGMRGGQGGVRRGGIVKRGSQRGGTSRNRLLAMQMASRPSVRAALSGTRGRGGMRGGMRGRGMGGRGGGGNIFNRQNNRGRGGMHRGGRGRIQIPNTTRAAVSAAIHRLTSNLPTFRVNNRGGRGINRVQQQTFVPNMNRGFRRPQQQIVQQQVIRQQPIVRQQQQQINMRPNNQVAVRVNRRGGIQKLGGAVRGNRRGVRGGVRGGVVSRINRGVRISRAGSRIGGVVQRKTFQKRLSVQDRLGVRKQGINQRGGFVGAKKQAIKVGGAATAGVKVAARGRGGVKVGRGGGRVINRKQTTGKIQKTALVKTKTISVRGSRTRLGRGGSVMKGSRVVQGGRIVKGRVMKKVVVNKKGRGGLAAVRRRGGKAAAVSQVVQIKAEPAPTKQSLDDDLEAYMASSKTFLDKDIDSYMSQPPPTTVSSINPITAPL